MRRRAGVKLLAPVAGVVLLAMAFIATTVAVWAEEPRPLRGVALVIGNSDYRHLSALTNPANDARAVEMLLSALGFETELSSDRDARRLMRDLDIFLEDAEGADVAILYYAGHGIEAGGENFLVPVDADLSALEAAGERLVPISAFVERLQATVPVTIVMLDACRDNPFPAGSTVRLDQASAPLPMGESGLGETRGATRIAPPGQRATDDFGAVIAFAAAPGQVALDGAPGGNSPYTAAVLRHLETMAGEEFGTVMRMVAEEVYLRTAGRQRPWVNESLRRLLYFGAVPEPVSGVEGDILTERRQLLITISALPAQGRSLVERVSDDRGVPMDALFAMLDTLGEDLPDDPAELDRLLRRLADDLKAVLEQRSALQSTDPEIVRLSQLAETATAEGALTTAVALYEQAKARVAELSAALDQTEENLRQRRIEYAEIYGRSGETRVLALDHRGAAADFAQAAREVERWDDELNRRYRLAQARALIDHGVIRGDTPALEQAVETLDRLARDSGEGSDAPVRMMLADALVELGRRQAVNDALERAVATYGALLEGDTGVDRADATRKRGAALLALGRREVTTRLLEEARAVLEDALALHPRDTAGSAWAAIQVDLGQLQVEVQQRRNEGVEAIDGAIAHYRAALELIDEPASPAAWASAQAGLGRVLRLRAALEGGDAAGWLRQSLAAFDAVLGVCGRETYPVCWAGAHHGRGVALYMLGSTATRDTNAAFSYFRQSFAALDAALGEQRFDMSPVDWAETHRSKAEMLRRFASWSAGGIREIYAALSLQGYERALAAITPESLPVLWFEISNSIAAGIAADDRPRRLKHLRAALDGFSPADDPARWATQKVAIAGELFEIGKESAGVEELSQAEAELREAAAMFDDLGDMPAWFAAHARVAEILVLRGGRTATPQLAIAALDMFDAAWNRDDVRNARVELHRTLLWSRDTHLRMASAYERPVLEREVERRRAALAGEVRDSDPLGWARGQYELAAFLRALAAGPDDAERRAQAIAAYRAALDVWTLEDHPVRFGQVQRAIGDFVKQNASGDGDDRYAEAVAAYELALEGLAPGHAPLDHAWLRREIGGILLTRIGKPANDRDAMTRAVDHFRKAAEIETVERSWGMFVLLQRQIAEASLELARVGAGNAHQEAAIEAYRLSVAASAGRGSDWWVEDTEALADLLVRVGDAEGRPALLRESFGHYEALIDSFAGAGDGAKEVIARSNHVRALYLAGAAEPDVALLERAVAELRRLMAAADPAAQPDYWAWWNDYLGGALLRLSEIDGREAGGAVAAFGEVLRLRPRETHEWDWARTTHNLASAMVHDARARDAGAEAFGEALAVSRPAVTFYEERNVPYMIALTDRLECEALAGIAAARRAPATAREAVDACGRALAYLEGRARKADLDIARAARSRADAVLSRLQERE